MQGKKEILNTGMVSDIISKEENLDDEDEISRDPGVFVSWVNQRHSLGQIFDLGIFQRTFGAKNQNLAPLTRTI